MIAPTVDHMNLNAIRVGLSVVVVRQRLRIICAALFQIFRSIRTHFVNLADGDGTDSKAKKEKEPGYAATGTFHVEA